MNPTQRRLIVEIKELRGERAWSQEALAKKAGISRAHIARLEIGRHDPSLSTLVKLAKALSVTVAALIGEGKPARKRAGR